MNYRKSIIKSMWMLGAGIMLLGNIASSRPIERPQTEDGGDTPVETEPRGPRPTTPRPTVPSTSGQTLPPADATVNTSNINVRVEVLSVTCDDNQEFFGADEPFLMWAFSGMRTTMYEPDRPYRAETHFGVTQPVSTSKGQTKSITAGTVMFDGQLPRYGSLEGSLMAMEEDEWRKWTDAYREEMNTKVLGHIEDEKRMRESTINSDWRPMTNQDFTKWSQVWWERIVPRPNITGFEDVDDLIEAQVPFTVPASGQAVENRSWQAKGDGATFTWRYRITRTPINDPAPAVPTPTPVVVPTPTTSPVVVPTATPTPKPAQPTPTPKPTATATLKPVPTATPKPAATATPKPVPTATPKPTATPTPKPATPTPTPKPTATATPKPAQPTPTPKPSRANGGFVPNDGVKLPAQSTGNAPIEAGNAFLPLKYFAARVDKVAPSTAGDKLEVFLTLKNRMSEAQSINGSEIYAVATDADGIGLMTMGFYRPEGEPELMAGNRELGPNGELKVRLLIDVPDGTSPFKTLTLWETTSLPQTFNISNVMMPGVRPAANLASLNLSGSLDEFKPCGETLDVRFDGFRKSRSGSYEAFFTFKNTSDTGLYKDIIEFNAGSLDVYTWGADGLKERYDSPSRANGEKAIPLLAHYAILSGGEAQVRYTFSSKNDVPKPVKVSVGNRAFDATAEWPVTSP